jgi:glutamate synthase (NADPH/NADH) large chain
LNRLDHAILLLKAIATAKTIDITYNTNTGKKIAELLHDICQQGSQAIKDGHSLIILSERKINENRVALSSLLASSALHQRFSVITECF